MLSSAPAHALPDAFQDTKADEPHEESHSRISHCSGVKACRYSIDTVLAWGPIAMSASPTMQELAIVSFIR